MLSSSTSFLFLVVGTAGFIAQEKNWFVGFIAQHCNVNWM
jgi:hypothetical protein